MTVENTPLIKTIHGIVDRTVQRYEGSKIVLTVVLMHSKKNVCQHAPLVKRCQDNKGHVGEHRILQWYPKHA